MPIRTPVYVVCSPLDRVGKTLVARLLTEFFIVDGRYVEAFDLNTDDPSLADYLPDCTVRANIAETRGQMAVFDQLVRGNGAPKIVDLGHTAFEPFFEIAAQVGLVAEAQRHNAQIVLLFVASPDQMSTRAYAALGRWLPGVVLVPVHNEALIRAPQRDLYPAGAGAALPLRVPLLAQGIARIVSNPAFSFADFRAGRIIPEVAHYRFEVESWLRRAFLEFRELELRMLLATLGLSR